MPRSEQIANLVERYLDGIRARDLDAVLEVIADGEVAFIGTDPDEFWTDRDTFANVLGQQLEEMGDDISVGSLDVLAYETGDSAGWFAGRSAFTTPDGDVPVRLSGAARRDGDTWKIAHFHASVGVANEEALGTELTT